MSKYNGGPAFPVLEGSTQWLGMTLRDHFATHIHPPEHISRLWGEVLAGPFPKLEDGITDDGDLRKVIAWWISVDAAWRYAHADAMLKARTA